MFLCYSFIGVLPSYIIDTVHQARCFYDGDIYLILDDMTSPHLEKLNTLNVHLIDYKDVFSTEFSDTLQKNTNKFCIVHGLIGREKLFIYSFERFFLLKNLMKKYELKDCLFLELDNLIYDDPRNWVVNFSTHQLCYMYDNVNRCSSGIMYVKNNDSLTLLLNDTLDFINTTTEFLTEMTVLYRYYEKNKDTVQLLPVHWSSLSVPKESNEYYDKYNNTIFDAAAIGVYLLGRDPYHTNGMIVRYLCNPYSAINYTHYKFEWKTDEKGLNKPYIWDGEKWLLINNLHVHSKDLKSGLSLPIE